jgi:hypothetical protein
MQKAAPPRIQKSFIWPRLLVHVSGAHPWCTLSLLPVPDARRARGALSADATETFHKLKLRIAAALGVPSKIASTLLLRDAHFRSRNDTAVLSLIKEDDWCKPGGCLALSPCHETTEEENAWYKAMPTHSLPMLHKFMYVCGARLRMPFTTAADSALASWRAGCLHARRCLTSALVPRRQWPMRCPPWRRC